MYCQRLLTISFLCCLPLFSVAQQTSTQPSPEVAKVLELEKKWNDSYKLRNIPAMTALLTEDFMITIEDGRVFGKAGYISHTVDSSVQVDMAEETDLKVKMHANVAVVTGAYHETGTAKGKRYEYRDRLTDVWIKTEGQWRLIASHYSIPVQL